MSEKSEIDVAAILAKASEGRTLVDLADILEKTPVMPRKPGNGGSTFYELPPSRRP